MSGFPVVREFLHNEALRIGFIGSLLPSSLRAWTRPTHSSPPLSALLHKPAPPLQSAPFQSFTSDLKPYRALTSTEIVF